MSARVSFADLLKAGADKDKQRLNLKLASPALKAAAPEKDFTRVANSIVREAVPDGLFIGKSKQIYDYLYSITRGAVQPTRSVRVTKTNLMQNADIGSERTLRKNLIHLQSLGLIKIIEFEGQHQGNGYETFLPEEILSDPPHPPHPRHSHQSLQKVGGVPPAESGVGGVGQTIENKEVYSDPKTLIKDFKSDDEPAALYTSDNKIAFRQAEVLAEMSFETSGQLSLSDANIGGMEKVINEISKKLIGKELKSNDNEKLRELAELLVMELEIAAARTDTISNVPAFLTEHLRRRLLGKPNVQTSNKTSGAKSTGKTGKDVPVDKIDNSIQTAAETYQAESLTAQARETVLKTMREYIGKGQREFVMSLRDTYTTEDWKWLSKNLPDEAAEK